jgi:hypothetical protein
MDCIITIVANQGFLILSISIKVTVSAQPLGYPLTTAARLTLTQIVFVSWFLHHSKH